MGRLEESGDVVFDAAGYGVVILQPLRANENWHVTRMSIQASSSVLVPRFVAYRRFIAPSTVIDNTYDGNNNTSNCDEDIFTGEQIIGEWSAGDVGAIGTFIIYGERRT